jgi:hypothetical protein
MAWIGAMPDAGVELVQVFNDESAAGVFAVGADGIEGEDERIAELGDVVAEPECAGGGHFGAMDEICANSANDGAVGADDRAGGIQVQFAEHAHGVTVAAAGGDDRFDTGGFGGLDCGSVAWAYTTVRVQQCAVHVHCYEAIIHHFRLGDIRFEEW